MAKATKSTIHSFRPDADVARQLKLAIRLRAGGKSGASRGLQSKIINEALRAALAAVR